MKIIVTFLLLGCVANGLDYRYRRNPKPPRGILPAPPPPPQAAVHSQFIKKWEHRPVRTPNRRPHPNHIKQSFSPPPLGPPKRPTTHPYRTYWKTTKHPYRPIEVKPFHSSPSLGSSLEYDYHVQTNNIPNIQPIKQVGEKGPIHTIPAPNLSLGQKPTIVEENVKTESKRHQYQVTELNDYPRVNAQKLFREQQLMQRQQQQQKIQQQQQQQQQQLFQQQFYTTPKVEMQTDKQTPQITSQELYQLLNNPQPQSSSNVATIEQIPVEYQMVAYQPEVYQQEKETQAQISFPTEKDAAFLTSQYTASDNYPEVKEEEEGEKEQVKLKGKIESPYFATLPNQQIADSLASLQEAGQVNTNLQLGGGGKSMHIYVPDEHLMQDDQNDEIDEEGEIEEANVAVFGSRIRPKSN